MAAVLFYFAWLCLVSRILANEQEYYNIIAFKDSLADEHIFVLRWAKGEALCFIEYMVYLDYIDFYVACWWRWAY